ncbi:MAG: DNA helicase RecQ [Sulfurimonas sp.]|nr:MAG: DNA helicase RecQ [Sulfurimonas sp.]
MVNKLLKTVFGFDEFRAFQKEAVDSILDNGDLMLILPTGGGKSLCYQLPSLVMDGVTIVISPLIALMQDQVAALKNNSISADMISSAQDYEEIQSITKKLLNNELKLLYIAPERLSANGFVNLLKQININFFVIDEAHCVSEWGHEFRSDYRNLSKLKEIFPHTPVAAFTATATHKVQADIINTLKLNNPTQLRGKTLRDNITINAQKRISNGREQLVNFLSKHKGSCGIVYAFSRKEVQRVSEFLISQGFKADAYHAGLSNDLRSRVYNDFIFEKIDIVVATIAFGMGIDKSNIRFVAHISMPKTMENYYQEIGRAGRDGLKAETLLLFTKSDEIKRRMLIDDIQDTTYKDLLYNKLNKMYTYANSSECRHELIAKYFDDEIEACGDICDSCLRGEITKVDISTESMKLLSTIYRCNQSFGLVHIIDVLRGSKAQRISQFGHENLSVYGIGKDKSKNYYNSVSDRLFELDALEIGEFRAIKIKTLGYDILKKKISVDIDEEKLVFLPKNKSISDDVPKDEVFERFRTLRFEISCREKVPAYIVFSDKTLLEFASKLPQNKTEALDVNGVGEVKYERYGQEFVDLCKEIKDDIMPNTQA